MALRYQEYGEKNAPLIVFLHGGGVSGWMWDKQIPHFMNYHCLVPDLPWHGKSDNHLPFSIKESASEVIDLIEEKAEGKEVNLVGFSLGAQVIIQILGMKPDLANRAIINSALVRPVPYAKKIIKPIIRMSYPFVKYRWFSKLQAKTLYIGDDHFEQYYRESRQMKQDALVKVLEENMSFGIPENFQEAKGRILVTVGEEEKAVMRKSAVDVVRSNQNCTGILIPGIGHGAPLAKPECFNQIVETWIKDEAVPTECSRIRA
ncbi:hydrolase [Bacillus sp. FJAT-27225]|uniref:alpha/beta fold hydrolase n=1 Tax=Bacillus sp. FJAT-27225 TaxID=1743144 RepID=UPI00080C26B0|nr:alpha/beta hydrolase [Bacillus sp. FJAT-27225]OCA83200.1 hydrolase [Bacillus sp. FJAT-27225]